MTPGEVPQAAHHAESFLQISFIHVRRRAPAPVTSDRRERSDALACGKQLGRPRRIVNREEVLRLRAEGASLRQIAEKLGLGYGTVRLRLRNALKAK